MTDILMNDSGGQFVFSNAVFTAGLLIVLALRKPVRAMFGARLAYALWLLPLLALAVSFMPPHVKTVMVPVFKAAQPHLFVPSVGGDAPAVRFAVAPAVQDPFDLWAIAGLVWIAGALAMAAWLGLRQSRFLGDVRDGRAGPAVVGFFRPRIVTPADFETRFEPGERDVILTHESVHLARHDAHVNALVALVRCVCWYNPLVHFAAHCLRIDQELACDALVVQRHPKARRTYADALLKAQLAARPLPLGCYWPPGAEHPLMERIEMLKRNAPGPTRRIGGVAVLAVLLSSAGLGAWAALPTQVKVVAAPPTQDFPQPVRIEGRRPAPLTPPVEAAAPLAADTPVAADTPAPAPQPEPRTALKPVVHAGSVDITADSVQTAGDTITFTGHVLVRMDTWPTRFATQQTEAPPAGANTSSDKIEIRADAVETDAKHNILGFTGNLRVTRGGKEPTAEDWAAIRRLGLIVQPTRYEPQQPAPQAAPAGYLLGAGDEIKVTVLGEPNLSGAYVVDAQGAITLPLAGQIVMQKLTLSGAGTVITERLKNGFLKDPKVSVELTKPRVSPVLYQSPAPDDAYDSANPFLLKGAVESVKIAPAGILLTVSATSRSIDGQPVPDTRTWTVNTGGSPSAPELITSELTGKTLYMWGYPKAGPNCATACEMYAPDYVIPAAKQAGLTYQTFEVNPIQMFPNGGYAFAAKFDANAPVLIKGVVEKVEIGLPYTRVLVRGAAADGQEKLWLADGPRPAALTDEMHRKLLAGATVTIRGYLAKDKTCDPVCSVNARDLTIH